MEPKYLWFQDFFIFKLFAGLLPTKIAQVHVPCLCIGFLEAFNVFFLYSCMFVLESECVVLVGVLE